jgi:iron(II)-dependent oxidoreductase
MNSDRVLRSQEDVHAYVGRTCFKTGPPRLVGLEAEWHIVDRRCPSAAVPLSRLRAAVDPLAPLPAGSTISFEPGGQLELSTFPAPGLSAACERLSTDLDRVSRSLADAGLDRDGRGLDPRRAPNRQVDSPRYAAMAAFFDTRGAPLGAQMMCSTASLQVNVATGTSTPGHVAVAERWRLAHALGPVLVAAFANSPLRAGRPTGWRSTRQAIWDALDPGRTRPPPPGDPVDAYARYALDAEVMLVRRPHAAWVAAPGLTFRDWLTGRTPYGRPTEDDLAYHLTTLFPPVRPRGWLELRMIDAQPDDGWPVAAAVVTALLDDPLAADLARAATAPVADRWPQAARQALTDRPLALAARTCFAAALDALARLGAAALVPTVAAYADRYVARGRCPADDLLDPLPTRTPMPLPPRHRHRSDDGRDEAALKRRIADELDAVRRRSLALTELDDADLVRQHSPLMSPLVWDLAHVGNYEELWLLRAAGGREPLRPEIDELYDAFRHPRAQRPSLPLLSPHEARGYLATIRDQALDVLDTVPLVSDRPLLADGFVFGLVVQHEHQHDETMLATHQLRRGEPALADPALPPPAPDPGLLPPEVLVPAGPFQMGTSTDPWAYDNERPAHLVHLPAYWIDTTPVPNRAYLAFIDCGGYDERRWWTDIGWEWRCRSGKRAPAFWLREGGQWLRRRFGQVEPLPADEPVQHVCFHEARAYATWAGKRLPTEAEWEKAAGWDPAAGRARRHPWGDELPGPEHANLGQRQLRPTPVGSYPGGASAYGVRQLLGDVWEWTSSDFRGYPGFRAFPYAEYSAVFFGCDYKVLRGGSWATHPSACRTTFRNWDFPIRRQIFAGFRCARDAAPGDG